MTALIIKLGTAAALGGLLLLSSGCEDDAICFENCAGDGSGAAADGGGGSSSGVGGNLFNQGGGGEGTGGHCEITNAGIELCDTVDNDCDGSVDEDFDFNQILNCGTCENNCFAKLLNVDPNTISCTWDGTANTEGTCAFTACASDYFDVDGDGIDCEYYCVQSEPDDSLCNNRDDDCDGVKDEDVNLCSSIIDCGACGAACSVVHGIGKCVDQGQTPCTPANTQCEIDTCDDDDSDGNPDWWDLDGSYATGCEYPCSLTAGGIEICGDNIDNDCDGYIDGADSDLTGDPQIGQVCYGANCTNPLCECIMPAHAGLTDCVGNQVECVGVGVLHANEKLETCDGLDNDCNDDVDDFPTDAGGSCGVSNLFPCTLGTEQCINGGLQCVGNNDPQTDNCDGIDNDCDGGIDTINNGPPADAGGPCDVPIPPPAGATSPCAAGTLDCSGGALICAGSSGPTSATDGCGDDSNCDGVLTGQPDLTSDVQNCGSCGNSCYIGHPNSQWSCDTSLCHFDGCNPGWWDLDNDEICEYNCVLTNGGVEICDGLDNDCNNLADDGLTTPGPTDVCGVSPAATRPECTSGVTVACTACGVDCATWQCTFPSDDVCTPDCASEPEICDTLDNNCDGGFNENVGNYGQPCFSDEGQAPPGHGACQTQGNYVCNGPNDSVCDAVKEDCSNLLGGCDEECDGIDNDCDGAVDENHDDAESGDGYFLKPDVIRIASNRWMFAYEASRPNAASNSAGTGNGYFCASGCGSLPPAPANTAIEQTQACSVPDVLPWFNVTPIEVEQTCNAIGGFICTSSDWQTACRAGNSCDWGYNPNTTTACRNPSTGTKYCNLHAFDFDTNTAGYQDGLLPGGSPLLANCWADWLGLQQNTEPGIYDITGNLREITKSGSNVYPLMGGAFNTPEEQGASCDFDFYAVTQTFALLDTGFRCCFDSDPTQ